MPSARVTWAGKRGQSHARPSPRSVKTNARDSWAHSFQTDVTGAWGALQRKGGAWGSWGRWARGLSVSLVGTPGGRRGAFPSRQGRAPAAGCRLPSCLRAVEGSMGPSAVLSQEPERVGRVLTQLSRFQGTGTRSRSSLFWRINFS